VITETKTNFNLHRIKNDKSFPDYFIPVRWLKIIAVLGLLLFAAYSYAGTVSVPSSPHYGGAVTINWSSGGSQYVKIYFQINGGSWMGGTMYTGYAGSVSFSFSAGVYTFRADSCYQYPPYYQLLCATGYVSDPVTVVTSSPSGTPSISLASIDYDGNYSFNWNSIANTTQYKWQQRINGGSWPATETTTSSTTVTRSNSGGTYGYRVRACNPNGCSGYSSEKSITIFTTPPTSIPSIIIPAVDYDGSYSFSWNLIPYATNYKWQQRVDGSGWGNEITTSGTSVSILSNGSGTYGYHVKACNPNGCGVYSNEATITVVGDTTAYQYDELGRLIEVTHPNSVKSEYEYDAADNRTLKQSSTAN
jgi:YD repeat-containing protein